MKFGSIRTNLRFSVWQTSASAIVIGALFASTPCVNADPPLTNTERASTAPKSPMELKAEHGPWLILAASFEGDTAKEQSEKLATELRHTYKLNAYVMNKQFDYTQAEMGSGFDSKGNQKRMRYRDRRVIQTYAVLVGDFDSVDSKDIKDKLDRVKRIKPNAFNKGNEKTTDPAKAEVTVSTYRKFLKQFEKPSEKEAPNGPMASAFVTRNPLLPIDFFSAPEVDRMVRNMNQDGEFAEHSLLDCPGKFTVRVATFRGEDQFVSGASLAKEKVSDEEQQASQLNKAAEKARLTMRALRAAGYEAYQFHDRNSSIVTVGSFNELGREDAKKNFAYTSTIQEIVNRFGSNTKPKKASMNQPMVPKILFDLVDQRMIPSINQGTKAEQHAAFAKHSVSFDVHPTPMAVPKLKTSSIYSGTKLGKGR